MSPFAVASPVSGACWCRPPSAVPAAWAMQLRPSAALGVRPTLELTARDAATSALLLAGPAPGAAHLLLQACASHVLTLFSAHRWR